VGATKVGAVFGTFLGGALMVHYGRRVAIALDSVFFMAGPLVMAASYSIACGALGSPAACAGEARRGAGALTAHAWPRRGLVAGRALVGLGIGISAVVVPVYLGEIAPAGMRGRIVEARAPREPRLSAGRGAGCSLPARLRVRRRGCRAACKDVGPAAPAWGPRARGPTRLLRVQVYEVLLCLGMLAAVLADWGLQRVAGGWRWMVGLPLLPALVLSGAPDARRRPAAHAGGPRLQRAA